MSSGIEAAFLHEIARYGEALTFRHRVDGTYDSTTRSYTGGSVSTAPIKGFLAPFRKSQIDGANVLAGDSQCFIAGPALARSGIEPRAVDAVERSNGDRFRVVNFDSYLLRGDVVAYTFQLRGL